MEFVQAPGLPAPAGHYAQAVVTRDGLVFVSAVVQARDVLNSVHKTLWFH